MSRRKQVSNPLVRFGKNLVHSDYKSMASRDFPGGGVIKNPPANAGDTGSSPGLGRSHMLRSN